MNFNPSGTIRKYLRKLADSKYGRSTTDSFKLLGENFKDLEKRRKLIKQNLAMAVGYTALVTPISAGFENGLVPLIEYLSDVDLAEYGIRAMTDEFSIKARLLAGAQTFAFGSILFGARYVSTKASLETENLEGIKNHDKKFTSITSPARVFLHYMITSLGDKKKMPWAEIGLQTILQGIFYSKFGDKVFWGADVCRYLLGVDEDTHRNIPKWLRNASSKTKKKVVAGAFAASMALTAGIYHLTPDEPIEQPPIASQGHNLTDIVTST